MKKPILVATTRFVRPVETRIDNEFEVRRKADGTPFQHDELLAAAEGADALFVTPFDRLDADFFERVSPSVKVISTYSIGVDHIDLQAAAHRHIAIGNTPSAVTDATADIAMLLLLGASRRAFEAQELVRSGEWTRMKLWLPGICWRRRSQPIRTTPSRTPLWLRLGRNSVTTRKRKWRLRRRSIFRPI